MGRQQGSSLPVADQRGGEMGICCNCQIQTRGSWCRVSTNLAGGLHNRMSYAKTESYKRYNQAVVISEFRRHCRLHGYLGGHFHIEVSQLSQWREKAFLWEYTMHSKQSIPPQTAKLFPSASRCTFFLFTNSERAPTLTISATARERRMWRSDSSRG